MTGMISLSNLVAWSAQVALLVGVAFGALALLRVDAPGLRHGFLRAVLAACLLLPFVQPLRPAFPHDGAGVVTTEAAVVSAEAGAAPSRGSGPAQLVDRYAAPGVMTLIVAGMVGRLAWMALGIGRLRRLRSAGSAAETPAYDDLQRVLGTRASIRAVGGLGQPVTFGFRSPIVLIPTTLAAQPVDIQRAVVAHELWHVRRRDWLWTVIEEVLRALFWFHPAIWILLSRIQGTREEVVDRLAIMATGSRRTYVDALLTYAGESPLCGSTAFGRRRHLVRRLVLISKEAVMSGRRVVACGAVLAVVTACSGWYAVQAFPLAQAAAGIDVFTLTPGPTERSAGVVTPENPVPRRLHAVPADYPPEAAALGVRAAATVMLTIDGAGRVTETRVVGYRLEAEDPAVLGLPGFTAAATRRVTLPDGNASTRAFGRTVVPSTLEGLLNSVTPERRENVRRMLEALTREAARAASQWQYDPPAAAPLAFAVTVPIGGDPARVAALLREGARPASAAARPAPTSSAPVTQDQPGAPDSQSVASDGALRIGGSIKAPTKVHHVNPVYPPDAMDARVAGVIILECRIEADGTVSDITVLRSIPMLDDAAVDAVQQWEFTPTWLNGEPVPVIMTVTVNFTLQ